MKWKMSIPNFSVRKRANYRKGRSRFISLSSLSNRHVFCSDFRLERACCFADELWLSRMAYLGELFTCLVCWMPVCKKRLKTTLLTLWQNKRAQKKKPQKLQLEQEKVKREIVNHFQAEEISSLNLGWKIHPDLVAKIKGHYVNYLTSCANSCIRLSQMKMG